ncbi:MAG: hypothetical protein GXO42_03155 [bacterium]|nr:hypothetical protein [bacterium]
MQLIFKVIGGFLLPFLLTYYYMPKYIKKAREKNIVGIDVNKPHHPVVPEMGGIVPVLALVITYLIYIVAFPNFTTYIVVTLFLMLAGAFFGMLDDIFAFTYKDHILAMFFAAAIALALLHHYIYFSTKVYIPFLGWVNFGLAYWLLMLLWLVFVPNAVNIYALFNGLEAGTMLIIATFLLPAMILLHSPPAVIALDVAFIGALLGFFLYNKYPAQVFPGDVGTLGLGAVLASVAMLGKVEAIAAMMMLLYFLQFFLLLARAAKRIKDSRHPIVLDDGRLLPPSYDPYKVMYLLLKIKPMTEKEAVYYLLLLQLIISAAVLGILLLSLAL